MRLLDRYLLRELLVPLSFCLGGFFIFWIAFDLFSELEDFRENGVGPTLIMYYYLLMSPSLLKIVLPMGLLLAMLYALTTHARHNEITAVRSAGISLWRICAPYFAVGFMASVGLFALNERWAPQWEHRANSIRISGESDDARSGRSFIATKLGFENARDGRTWMIERYDTRNGQMYRPQVHWYDKDGLLRSLYAEHGWFTNGIWHFQNAGEYKEDPTGAQSMLPVRLTNHLALPLLTETPEQIRSEVWVSDRLSNLRSTKEADVPLSVVLDYLRLHPNPDERVAPWVRTMLHSRMASPWTCLVVVLIAVPFAGATGRKDMFVGVASSIGICFIYFVLERLCIAMGVGGYLPPVLAAWLPNVVFSTAAILMILRIR